ncbi:NUDIX hydrolase [bacterium]|nr:NUDIX hydrolase [bacterium]
MKKRKKIIHQPEKLQIAVDIVIFTIIDDKLKILLIQRATKPFKGKWALPGGHVDINESLEKAAKRELQEETNVKKVYLEQLYTFGDPSRDPRGRVISVTYFALLNKKPAIKSASDAADVRWFNVKEIPSLAFDHNKIVSYALKRLRWKLEYTNIAQRFLPRYFTLTELQRVYEIIFGKKIDKRNFRKKILSLNLIRPSRRKRKMVAHRPPRLWQFVSSKNVILTKRELIF